MTIKQANRYTSQRRDTCANKAGNRAKSRLARSEFAIISPISRTEGEVKLIEKEWVSRDKAFLAGVREKVSISRLSSVLTDCTILDEALSFVENMFTLFRKLIHRIFEAFLRKLLTRNWFHGKDSHATLTFVRSGYVV